MLILTALLLVAANTNGSIYFAPDSSTAQWEVEEITLTPNADSATSGTNYVGITAYKGSGTSTALTSARSTASTSLTAPTSEKLALTATGDNLVVTQANPLQIAVAKTGTGVAVNCQVTVRFRIKRV